MRGRGKVDIWTAVLRAWCYRDHERWLTTVRPHLVSECRLNCQRLKPGVELQRGSSNLSSRAAPLSHRYQHPLPFHAHGRHLESLRLPKIHHLRPDYVFLFRQPSFVLPIRIDSTQSGKNIQSADGLVDRTGVKLKAWSGCGHGRITTWRPENRPHIAVSANRARGR